MLHKKSVSSAASRSLGRGLCDHTKSFYRAFKVSAHVRRLLPGNAASCSDNNEIALLDRIFGVNRAVCFANDSLCAIAFDRSADLFRYGDSDAVSFFLFGIRASQTLCGIIGQNVYCHRFAYGSLPLGVRFGIQMIFTDCSEFQSQLTCLENVVCRSLCDLMTKPPINSRSVESSEVWAAALVRLIVNR